MSVEDFKFLIDPDPDVRDAAWWKMQFDWHHERLEEEERKRMRNEPSYSWVYRDLPKESSSLWYPFAIGVFIGIVILALFFGVLANKDATPAPVSNPSSCVDRLG